MPLRLIFYSTKSIVLCLKAHNQMIDGPPVIRVQ